MRKVLVWKKQEKTQCLIDFQSRNAKCLVNCFHLDFNARNVLFHITATKKRNHASISPPLSHKKKWDRVINGVELPRKDARKKCKKSHVIDHLFLQVPADKKYIFSPSSCCSFTVFP